MEQKYDLAVIGGGPGGYVAAIRAAQYGIKTVLIEEKDIGGTCLNRGCVPTKALLHSCEVLDTIKKANEFGIKADVPDVNISDIYKYKDKTVDQLKYGVESLLKSNGVNLINSRASFVDSKTIEYYGKSGSIRIKADNIIIATGSVPAVPPIQGLGNISYWTSDTLLEKNPGLPISIIIIGGGVIGVECATILNKLGVEVTILEMMSQLLPNMDNDVALHLKYSLEQMGIIIKTEVKVEKVSVQGNMTKAVIRSKDGVESVSSETVMIAVGRKSRLDGLNIEASGVYHKNGIIGVNKQMKTNIASIYAIGDVTGHWQLAHAASAQGLIAIDSIAGKKNNINMNIVPACVYTRPEISSVGMTEKSAVEAGYSIKSGFFSLSGNSKAIITGENKGFVKIISDSLTGAVLGGQIIGPRATDLISEITLAISSELTIEELGGSIHPHPTVSESIMESVHDIESLSIHKMPKRIKEKTLWK